MKRILFMHHVSVVGGASYCLLNIVKALDRTKWEPLVALKSYGPLVEELNKINVSIVFFPHMESIPYNKSLFKRESIYSYFLSINSGRKFNHLLHDYEIDVVYLNNMMLYPYLRPAKEYGCKTVLHVREHWPLNEHRVQLYWAKRNVFKYADCLIAINEYSASIFPNKKSIIVYDWIDMSERLKHINMNDLFGEDCSNKTVLLYNGGLQMIKGPNYIVKAFSEKITGDKYRLLIMGVDHIKPLSGWRNAIKKLLIPLGYKFAYKEMIDTIMNDDRIKCVPAEYEMTDYYLKSSCYVSYFSIPHANLSMAESLCLKTPCIVADNEEAREYSNNGEYAMLVEPNNYDVFSKRLQSFIQELGHWKKRAIIGSEIINEKFNKQLNISKLRNALNSLYNA